MVFLGEEVENRKDCTPFVPRCTKDVIEEGFFLARRDLFSGLDCVIFDTTSSYFEGEGGAIIGSLEGKLKTLQEMTIEDREKRSP